MRASSRTRDGASSGTDQSSKPTTPKESAMNNFISRFADAVTSTLSGFDRLVFRGSLIPLVRDGGMYAFLCRAGVRLLDFKKYVVDTSNRIKEAAANEAKRRDRPRVYLHSSRTSKEDKARELLAKHPTKRGLICTLSTIEPCTSFEYHRSPDPNERGLKLRPRKCLHLYKYFLHPTLGFMNARLQTWFPFKVQICINGREWLARQLARRGSKFQRADNCFTWLGNPKLGQRLMDEQLQTNWPQLLGDIARSLNPLHDEIFAPWPMDYYWSTYQCEWATDLLFEDPRSLERIYPALARHAMHHFKSPDVMRFLGRKAHGNFTGEITTSFKDRAEGVRVKHWVRGNSIKMYDKAGSVLRVETTLSNPKDFKVYRPRDDEAPGTMDWRPLRKGVADLHRWAEISQRSNDRYYDALAAADHDSPCAEAFDAVARPVVYRGRRARALRIGDLDELELLQAISNGEFTPTGFRNRDIRRLLYPNSSTLPVEQVRRLSARIGRRLRLLRAHGVVKKINKTHRYQLTSRGLSLTTALTATRGATPQQLNGLALAA